MCDTQRAWVELDPAALVHNVAVLRALLPAGCPLMPALKAQAYGHGAVLAAKTLESCGVTDFCVACLEEAAELRRAGVRGQLLVLGYTHPDAFADLARLGAVQTVVDAAYARQLSAFAAAHGLVLPVHVGVDTGMHRLGLDWRDTEGLAALWTLPGLRVTGVFSHLCVADGDSQADRAFTLRQGVRFAQTVEALRGRGLGPFCAHLQGSYGLLCYPQLHFDACRAGLVLYGVHADGRLRQAHSGLDLRPMLALKARIASLRTVPDGEYLGYGRTWRADGARRIATVTIGYADGLPRALSNRGAALVNGRRAAIAGRLCMDQLMLDVTGIPDVRPGGTAVFVGESEGSTLPLETVADTAGAITHELLCGLSPRLARVVLPQNLPRQDATTPQDAAAQQFLSQQTVPPRPATSPQPAGLAG